MRKGMTLETLAILLVSLLALAGLFYLTMRVVGFA